MNNTNNNTNTCVVDEDCELPLLCYESSFRWVNSPTGENVCECNTWFGYTGDDCTNFGIGSYVVFLSIGLGMIVSIIGIYMSCSTLCLLFNVNDKIETMRRRRSSSRLSDIGEVFDSTITDVRSSKRKQSRKPIASGRKNKTKSSINAVSVTSLFGFIGIIFFFLYRVSHLVLMFSPTNLILREESGIIGEARAHFLEEKVDPILIIFIGIFMCLSVMNLSLVWIDNVRKIQSFTVESNQRVIRYKVFLFIVNIIWVIMFLTIPSAEVVVIIIILLIIATISYIIAVYYLKKLQKGMNSNNGRTSFTTKNYWLDILIKRMVDVRRRIVIGTLLCILGGVFYTITSIQNSWREYSPVGYPSAPMVGNEVLIFGLGFIQLTVINFLYRTAKKPVKTKTKSRKRSFI